VQRDSARSLNIKGTGPFRFGRMSTQLEKAEELRRLHAAPEPLVLVNVWDAASARVVAGAAGCRALATASWAIAAARGLADGEVVSREAMLDAVGVVARATELPVTADLERGYGDVRMTVEGALEAGAVGCNLEDSDGAGGLWPAEEHAAVVAAARAAGDAAGIPLVINARTDVYLEDVIPSGERLVAALERGAAYLDAGADCVFVPGVRDVTVLEALARDMGGPISVLAGAGGPPLVELARIGVARVSYGPGPLGVAMAALSRAAEALLAGGDPPADLAYRP
jgi:2-methylisocitrate lyase-like PEP mutase family enzyme